MGKDSWKTWLLVILAVGFIALAAWRIPVVTELRRQYDLETANPLDQAEIVSELPIPTVALFTFRSLAIDYLWIRADTLKNKGEYFDALHLARLICKLQPNLGAVWDFQAWNMAYNISVAMPTCPERWHWVDAGIRLLRDEGLHFTPEDTVIYRSLSWILQHKVGEIGDDCHRFYKLKFATDVMRTLGTGFVTESELEAMVQAPQTWSELTADTDIEEMIDLLIDVEPKFTDRESLAQGLCEARAFGYNYSPDLQQFIADSYADPTFQRLDAFVRARALRQEWKMDPNLMLEINRRYGPLDYEHGSRILPIDWRLPYPHAIYWAVKGLQFTDVGGKKYLDLTRQVYQTLMDMFHYGHLQLYAVEAPAADASDRMRGQEILSPALGYEMRLFVSQDLRMFPVAYSAVLQYIQSYIDRGERVPRGMEAGSINMARTGIVNLYLTKRLKMARTYYRHLRERYPEKKGEYDIPLDQFVNQVLEDELRTPTTKYTSEYVLSLLRESYAFYAVRDDTNATIKEAKAEKSYRMIVAKYADQAERAAFPKFGQMRLIALEGFLNDPSIVREVKGLLMRRMEIEQPQKYQALMDYLDKQRSPLDGAPAAP